MTQNNLANAYKDIGETDAAIAAYQLALQIHTPAAVPLDCLQTGRNLGNLGYDQQNWEIAILGYDNAIQAVEQSRNWATSPHSKRQTRLHNPTPMAAPHPTPQPGDNNGDATLPPKNGRGLVSKPVSTTPHRWRPHTDGGPTPQPGDNNGDATLPPKNGNPYKTCFPKESAMPPVVKFWNICKTAANG